jgi:hypothetical protein
MFFLSTIPLPGDWNYDTPVALAVNIVNRLVHFLSSILFFVFLGGPCFNSFLEIAVHYNRLSTSVSISFTFKVSRVKVIVVHSKNKSIIKVIHN